MTALALSACAEVQRIPGEVRYGAPVVEHSEFTQQPLADQKAKVALRSMAVTAPSSPTVTAVRILEVRLAEAPLCSEAAIERMDGVHLLEGKLGRQDEVIMWSGYGGAGLSALLVAIGMIRGQGAARGMGIFAVFGLPLAGVGAYETYRKWPLEEPVEPKRAKVSRRGKSCPTEQGGLPVALVGAETTVEMTLGHEWKALAISPGQADFKGETVIPTLVRNGKLTAILSNAAQTAAPVSAPALVTAPARTPVPVSVPAAPAPAPVTASTAPVRGCAAVAVLTEKSGWLPKAFFEQPMAAFKLEDGMSLNKVAQDKLGGKAFVWQLHELNPGLANLVDMPRPIEIKIPVNAQPAAFWKSQLPSLCE